MSETYKPESYSPKPTKDPADQTVTKPLAPDVSAAKSESSVYDNASDEAMARIQATGQDILDYLKLQVDPKKATREHPIVALGVAVGLGTLGGFLGARAMTARKPDRPWQSVTEPLPEERFGYRPGEDVKVPPDLNGRSKFNGNGDEHAQDDSNHTATLVQTAISFLMPFVSRMARNYVNDLISGSRRQNVSNGHASTNPYESDSGTPGNN